MPSAPCAAAIVLAAGEGTRMRSTTPKVLHRIAGRSLVGHALAAVADTAPDQVVVVLRHGRERVAAHVREVAPAALLADQDDVPGTGRAFACALTALDAAAAAAGRPAPTGRVLVTYGDVPLLRPQTLASLLAADPQAAVVVLTAQVADPSGYGRVLRGPDGGLVRIVEDRDADTAVRAVHEVNTGVYVIDLDFARRAVTGLRPANAAGELYLTDVVAAATGSGLRVTGVTAQDASEVDGVNDRFQLSTARRRITDRLLLAHMLAGVEVVDPQSTWVDVGVQLAPDAVIHPGTHLEGATVVDSHAEVGPATTLRDTHVEARARVVRSHVTGSRIGAGASVGPYAHLRAGTVLHADVKVGAFVETKNATVGTGAKVPHLSYVGDAEIGEGANLGAGTIVANYDGATKHRTTVGRHAFVGSNSVLIAPVAIGDGAYTAAGSVIDVDVPAGALAVARGRLHVSDGWVARRRPGSVSAAAAEQVQRAHNSARPVAPLDRTDDRPSIQSTFEGQDA